MVDRLKAINDELRGADADAGPWLPLESNPEVFTSFARQVGRTCGGSTRRCWPCSMMLACCRTWWPP